MKNETKEQLNQVIQKLRNDNEKYIAEAINFLNQQKDEDIIKGIDDGKIFEAIEKFKHFLPIQTIDMILTIDENYLKELMKQNCKEKYEMIQEKKYWEKVVKLFKQAQEKINEEFKNTEKQ